MTLELVPVEKFRVHEPFRWPDFSDQFHDAGDHSASQADDQCRFCLRGPVVEAQFRYTDPRRDTFERLLQRLWTKEYPGRSQAERYFRDQYRRNCRLSIIRSSFIAIEHFLLYIAKNGKTHLKQITREDLYGFIEQEQDRGMKPITVHTRLRSLKAFLRFLIADQLVDHRVLLRRITIKVPQTLPRAIDPDDVKRLLSVIKDVRNRAMILVLLRTGMRIGEWLDTKIKDVHLKERRIDIVEAIKNRTGRVVYLSDDALQAVKAWCEGLVQADRPERRICIF
jgi:site-specific recombinase XerD